MLSTPNLHTGLILTPDQVIVGPAGASVGSTLADETALITDDPDAIAAAHAFLDGLDDTTVVDEVFLDSALEIWRVGRVVPLAGIGSRAHRPRLPPHPGAPHVPAASRRLHPQRRRREPLGCNYSRL
ncbi:hypothetical protein [Rhodococcus rhodochrous]|uniref:hypothetical protein n=1 Tax=Rhodococcus rhodochrous TaxID=1829 RepID=UPI0027E1995A|nr:hypothetical protein [Rhodococcus rhodochrous]